MKKMLLILAGVLAVAGLVLAIVFYNPLMARYYHSKMVGMTIVKGKNYDQLNNAGVTGFVSMQGGATPYLVDYLGHDTDGGARAGSAAALGKVPTSPEGLAALIQSLEEARKPELPVVAWALSKYGAEARTAIEKTLTFCRNPESCAVAARILGNIGDAKSGQALTAAVGSSNDMIAIAAAEALAIIHYPPAAKNLVALAKRLQASGDAEGAKTACLALVFSPDQENSNFVYPELGNGANPVLLEAARKYCSKLGEGYITLKLVNSTKSENAIERDSALVIVSQLTASAKERVALAAVSTDYPDTIKKGLEVLFSVGTAICLDSVLPLLDSNNKEVACAALKTMGHIVMRRENAIGFVPSFNTGDKPNPRLTYIKLAIDKMQDRELRIAADEALSDMTDKSMPLYPVSPTYDLWMLWWDTYVTTSGMIKELTQIIKELGELDLGNTKTTEKFEKAKKLIARGDAILQQIEKLSIEAIAKWVEKQRSTINTWKYSVDKYQPLDVMK